MQRATISVNSVVIGSNDAMDISSWVSEGEAANWWGLPQREVLIGMDDDVSPYLSTRIESKYIVHTDGQPDSHVVVAGLPPEGTALSDIIYEHKFGALAAEYTISINDVTAEYHANLIAAYSAERETQCEADIAALLSGRQAVTHAMICINLLDAAANNSGTMTADQISAAKAAMVPYRSLFAQLNTIMAQRDADIAAYTATVNASS